jgi:hypothetical protein
MRSHRAADPATATGDDLSPPCEKQAPDIDDTTISTTKDIDVLSIDHLAECALIRKLDRLVAAGRQRNPIKARTEASILLPCRVSTNQESFRPNLGTFVPLALFDQSDIAILH